MYQFHINNVRFTGIFLKIYFLKMYLQTRLALGALFFLGLNSVSQMSKNIILGTLLPQTGIT